MPRVKTDFAHLFGLLTAPKQVELFIVQLGVLIDCLVMVETIALELGFVDVVDNDLFQVL
jgi:hypothetical protein